MNDTKWLSTKGASERLDVTLRTIYKLIDVGEIPAYKVSRMIRIKETDVDEYIDRVKVKPGSLGHLYPDTKP